MADKKRKGGFPFQRVQGFVALAVVVFVICGLVFHVATGTASVVGFDEIAAICPVGALEIMLGAKTFMLHPLVLLLVAVAVILVVGKAFCAWVCPFPWLDRLFHPKKKGKKEEAIEASSKEALGDAPEFAIDIPQGHGSCTHECGSCALAQVGGKRDGVQLDSRHAVLAGALASSAVFGFPVFCLICPVGISFATIIGLWNLFAFNEPSWGLVIFPVLLVLEVTVLRKWCSKICPISALVSLVATGNKFFKPKVAQEKCLREQGIDCHECVNVCPEQLDPHSRHIPECSKCGRCVEACPAQAISIKVFVK